MPGVSPGRTGAALFEPHARHYESWYATAEGRRAEQAEQALTTALLEAGGSSATILEVGCGTGHFTRWLAATGRTVYGLDRSPEMLAECSRLGGEAPLVLGDAHALPVRSGAVDAVLLVTALEFLADPRHALNEAVRVARRAVAVVALNRHSVGALRRRLRGGWRSIGRRFPRGGRLWAPPHKAHGAPQRAHLYLVEFLGP